MEYNAEMDYKSREERLTEKRRSKRWVKLALILHEERKKTGMSQWDLAYALGKGQAWVSKYEAAQSKLSVVDFLEVAEVLGIRGEASNLLRKVWKAGDEKD
ncbi:helix-turn-helix domain-containing protein [Gimesia chilikensis]|uniref:helix-turn-helix domain-containing protein n=1 Tax=Gimesia chilikensis TaxID=2605989 RepID=UPI003A8D3B81